MKDQISALVDGEISLEDTEHVYKAIKAGGVASESWAQYHLIGDAMRGTPVFNQDFTARLMQKIEQEPAILAPKLAANLSAKSANRSNITSSMWSVAASVAAVMFVGWMVLQQQVQSGVDVNSNVQIAEVQEAVKKIQEPVKNVPSEYLLAHQSYVPSNSAYIQPAAYSESGK